MKLITDTNPAPHIDIQAIIEKLDLEAFWSEQQRRIFVWFKAGSGNLVVRARAGTGKTTTIIKAIDFAPEDSILVCAFNKRIEQELSKRLTNPNATAKTLHALGYMCIRRYWERMNVERTSGQRAARLTDQVCPQTTPDAIKRLVTKLHTKGREMAPHAVNPADLIDIAYKFECDPGDEWATAGFDVNFVVERALVAMDLAATVKPAEIDFADMIFLPIRNGWMVPTYDLVVVDEAQDMTAAQLELAKGLCKGRFCLVGDDRQAIYDFRGADSNGLDRLKGELNAEELGLTVTYRCGKAIVIDAQRLVPDFTAGDNNPDGEILGMIYEKLTTEAAPSDFILSRTNAPLVKTAMALLRNQKRARIAGRDIGQGIKAIMRKINKTNSVPDLLKRLDAWQKKETDRVIAAGRPERAETIQDQAEIIRTVSDGATGVKEVEARIDVLFTDDGLGEKTIITCSSVHRAKGLEADRVFVLVDTLYPGCKALANGKKVTPARLREEQNIEYVAITRAKKTLVKVAGLK